MKRTVLELGTLLTLALASSWSIARQESDAPHREAQPGPARTPPGEAGRKPGPGMKPRPGPKGRRIDRSDVARRRYVAKIHKLQNLTKKKLRLSAEQKEAVDRLFTQYLSALRHPGSEHRPFGVNPADAEELTEFRKRLLAARKAGDDETVRRLRQELRDKMRTRQDAVALTSGQFIERVASELTEAQRPLFRKLVKTLRIGVSRGGRGEGGLRGLWRAVMSADVDLGEEQRRTIVAVLRDGAASVAEARRRGGKVAEVIAGVRREVLNQLTPAQRAKVEAVLRANPPPRSPGARIGHQEQPKHGEAGSVEPNEEQGQPPGLEPKEQEADNDDSSQP